MVPHPVTSAQLPLWVAAVGPLAGALKADVIDALRARRVNARMAAPGTAGAARGLILLDRVFPAICQRMVHECLRRRPGSVVIAISVPPRRNSPKKRSGNLLGAGEPATPSPGIQRMARPPSRPALTAGGR